MEPASAPWPGWVLRAASAAVLLLAWQALASLAGSPLFPTPLAVAAGVHRHVTQGGLAYHLGVTLVRVAMSFVAALGIGAAIGIVMGERRRIDRFFDLWLVLGLNIPALVIMILCYVWLGLNEMAAVLAVALNKIPVVVVTVREGARAVDRELLQVAEVLRLSRRRTLFKVYLPQLYPYLMAAARNGLSLIWKIVLVVELIGRSSGVGFQLGVYFQFFDITSVLAYTAAFVAVVILIEAAVMRPLENRLNAWRP